MLLLLLLLRVMAPSSGLLLLLVVVIGPSCVLMLLLLLLLLLLLVIARSRLGVRWRPRWGRVVGELVLGVSGGAVAVVPAEHGVSSLASRSACC